MFIDNESEFAKASADWQREVDYVATDLLRRGAARSPHDAQDLAKGIVKDRRRREAAGLGDMAKRFDDSVPLVRGKLVPE